MRAEQHTLVHRPAPPLNPRSRSGLQLHGSKGAGGSRGASWDLPRASPGQARQLQGTRVGRAELMQQSVEQQPRSFPHVVAVASWSLEQQKCVRKLPVPCIQHLAA